ncbi:hypothetical protein RRG08_005980 [Elysia crispata]|uniref:t-SNARE coiled-coil homology domain-containing protein n=1 Tax=Elysia crispata TaxID=231223 RepID=A0AAE1D256_9GAST|nr:hypothetical protein RRG08_005980 [Elysia crispata]
MQAGRGSDNSISMRVFRAVCGYNRQSRRLCATGREVRAPLCHMTLVIKPFQVKFSCAQNQKALHKIYCKRRAKADSVIIYCKLVWLAPHRVLTADFDIMFANFKSTRSVYSPANRHGTLSTVVCHSIIELCACFDKGGGRSGASGFRSALQRMRDLAFEALRHIRLLLSPDQSVEHAVMALPCPPYIPGWSRHSHLEASYRHVDSVARHVDSVARYVDSVARHVDSVARHVDSVARHVDSVARYVDSVARYVDSVARYVDSVARYVDSVARHVDSVARHVDSVARYVDSVARHVDSVARHVDSVARHVDSVARYVDSVARHVDSVARHVDSVARHVDSVARHVDSVARHVDSVARHVDSVARYVGGNIKVAKTARAVGNPGQIEAQYSA